MTHPFPMAGFCFFFQLSSLALIRESLTGPVWEMGMQEMKKDLSSPASLVTAFFRGLSSKRPAVHKPETKVDKDCEIETPFTELANIFSDSSVSCGPSDYDGHGQLSTHLSLDAVMAEPSFVFNESYLLALDRQSRPQRSLNGQKMMLGTYESLLARHSSSSQVTLYASASFIERSRKSRDKKSKKKRPSEPKENDSCL